MSLPIPQSRIEEFLELIANNISSLGGGSAKQIEIQKGTTHIQWRYVGDEAWIDLIAIADITGAKGDTGLTGNQGPQGQKGEKGDKGDKGDPNNTVATGTVLGCVKVGETLSITPDGVLNVKPAALSELTKRIEKLEAVQK